MSSKDGTSWPHSRVEKVTWESRHISFCIVQLFCQSRIWLSEGPIETLFPVYREGRENPAHAGRRWLQGQDSTAEPQSTGSKVCVPPTVLYHSQLFQENLLLPSFKLGQGVARCGGRLWSSGHPPLRPDAGACGCWLTGPGTLHPTEPTPIM